MKTLFSNPGTDLVLSVVWFMLFITQAGWQRWIDFAVMAIALVLAGIGVALKAINR